MTDADWQARFDAYGQRKIRQAADADLHPFQSEIDRPLPHMRAIGNAWSMTRFDGAFYLSPVPDDIPSTSLVFVQSRDGNTVAPDPSMLGGGDTDTHVVYEGLSRVAADAILAGARTLRGPDVFFSVWHPELVALRASLGLPRHPVQVIATLRGLALDAALLFNLPSQRVIIVTTAETATAMKDGLALRPWIRTIPLRNPGDLRAAFEQLRAAGIGRISAVGGRTVARALLDVGLVRDVYLTTSPRPGGEPSTPLSPKPLQATVITRKHGTSTDAGVTFEQLHLR